MKKLEGESFGGVEASTEKKYLPSFRITADDLPAVKDWNVGKTYELAIKVRMKSLEEQEKKTRAELEIEGIEVPKKDFEQEYGDKRSNAPRV